MTLNHSSGDDHHVTSQGKTRQYSWGIIIAMGLFGTLKNNIMKRNSYFLATIFAAAFAGEILVDGAVNAAWNFMNRGVHHI